MNLQKSANAAFFLLLTALSPVLAAAAGIGCDAPDPSDMKMETPKPPDDSPKRFTSYVYANYTSVRGTYDNNGKYTPLAAGEVKSWTDASVYLTYNASRRLDLSVYTGVQRSYRERAGQKADYTGLMDSLVYFWLTICDRKDLRPALYLLWRWTLPTGKYQHADPNLLGADIIGSGVFEHGYGLYYYNIIANIKFYGCATYVFPLENRIDGVKTDYGDYISYYNMIQYPANAKISGTLYFNGFSQGRRQDNGQIVSGTQSNALYLNPGIRYGGKNGSVILGYRRSVSGRNVSAIDGATFFGIFNF